MAKRRGRDRNRGPAGRVRIVAGKWRGRWLPVPDAPGLRPSAERVRETLFNWLAPTLPGTRCLDLFAGTGILGFEALSRGAAEVVFVERAPALVATLRASAALLGAAEAAILLRDARDYLQTAEPRGFDVVFLDPPFAEESLGDLCRLLHSRPWLARDACVYLEQGRDEPLPALPAGWSVRREKTAGNVRYSLVSARGHE